MVDFTLYYATNRGHKGKNRWNPTGYGTEVSEDGTENLRFGQVMLQADEEEISRALRRKTDVGIGDGLKLADYLEKKRRTSVPSASDSRSIAPASAPPTGAGTSAPRPRP